MLTANVSNNGTYVLEVTVGGAIKQINVKVNNYKLQYNVGDVVAYTAISREYNIDRTLTGVSSSNAVTTDTGITWRILSINEDSGKIKITPGVVNSGKIMLNRGVTGYMHGPEEFHNICGALYSNSTLGLTEMNMTIEELNYASNKFDPASTEDGNGYSGYNTKTNNVVFYPSGTSSTTLKSISGETIVEGGRIITGETDDTINRA